LGLLAPEAANRFIDYMWDATVLGSQVDVRRMRSNQEEFNRISIGERLVRVATEAVDDGVNVGVAFAKISLTVTKFRLDYEISTETLEDNLEGTDLEDHIARLMATQAGADLEYIAINGDTALTSDPGLKGVDGWSKRLRAGAHVVDAAGSNLDRAVIHDAIKALPRKYRQNKQAFKFFTGAGPIQDYLFSLQQNQADYVNPEAMAAAGIDAASTPEGPAGFSMGRAFGFRIQEVPLFREDRVGDYSGTDPDPTDADHTEMWLTDPKNLIWGVKREIRVNSEYKIKKDTFEFTMMTRVGTQVHNADAAVVVKNIKAS
jgi:hypothetical protein